MVLTPNFSAVSFATSTSLKPRCSKPTENVKRFGFISLAIEAMIDESIPPDKNLLVHHYAYALLLNHITHHELLGYAPLSLREALK